MIPAPKGLSQNRPAKHYKLNNTSKDHVSVPPGGTSCNRASQASCVLNHQEILVIQISKTMRYRFLSVLEVAQEAG
jgi:hypothetical protein